MENIKQLKLKTIMSSNLISSFPDMIMTEVSSIFDGNDFHHLPVIDEKGGCVGVISKSDYFQLQDQFTKFNSGCAEKNNNMLFRSLLASEVMSKKLEQLSQDDTVEKAIDIFLENKIHSIVIHDEGTCVGIVTPHDILKLINQYDYV